MDPTGRAMATALEHPDVKRALDELAAEWDGDMDIGQLRPTEARRLGEVMNESIPPDSFICTPLGKHEDPSNQLVAVVTLDGRILRA